MTEAALAQKKCTPCRGGVPPLNPDEVQSSLPQVTGWSAADGDTKDRGRMQIQEFSPDPGLCDRRRRARRVRVSPPVAINFGWGFCTIVLQTKKN